MQFLQQCGGIYVRALATAKRKLGFLEHVPYVFSKMDKAGARDQIMEQWRRIDPSMHRQLTRDTIGMEGPALLAMGADGSG
eukprot:7482680-Pyramimonas_sp.AAC.1